MSKKSRIQMLQSFAEEEPNNPFNWYALALEHMESDPLQAEIYFEKLLIDFSDYLPAYYHAAALFGTLGNLPKAISTYEAGIKLAQVNNDRKTLIELKNSYLNFKFEHDLE